MSFDLSINKDKCIGCGDCERDCPAFAINISEFSINNKCIRCGHCVAICQQAAVSINSNDVLSLKEFSINKDDVVSLFAHNRTAREFIDEPISEEDIHLLIESMKHYGSASNRREIELSILTNKNVIKELNDFVANDLLSYFTHLSKPLLSPLLRFFANKNDVRKIRSYKYSFQRKFKHRNDFICYKAPLVFIFHAPVSPVSMNDIDGAIWSANTVTLARTLGLHHCYNGYIKSSLNRNKKMKEKFGIPKSHSICIALLLGKSNVKYVNETGRIAPKTKILR